MRALSLVISLLFVSSAGRAQDAAPHHDHQGMAAASAAGNAPFQITINPEARVSVVMAGPLPPSKPCAMGVDMPVTIRNQGFVTARLEAQLVGSVPPGTVLDFHPQPLTGAPQETRTLHLALATPGTADLTISFRAHNEMPDIGGRDRVHFLMRCQ
jgi:hypothetical protein